MGDLTGKVAEQTNMIHASAGLQGLHEDLKVEFSAAQEAAAEAAAKLEEHEEDAVKQRREAQALLERLLADQRASFENATADLTSSAALAISEQKGLREALEQAKLEAEQLRRAHAKEVAAVRAEMAKMQKDLVAKDNQLAKAKRPTSGEKKRPKPLKETTNPSAKGSSPLGLIDLDEGPDAKPISEQLADALRKNATRVLDLFRSWDADGDGEVARAEFHRAMTALGLEVPKKSIDELFTEWDKDGGGSIGYKELQKILTRSSASSPKTMGDAGKAVAIVNKMKALAPSAAVRRMKK